MRIVSLIALCGCAAPQIVHPGPDPVTLARLQQCDEQEAEQKRAEARSLQLRELNAESAQLGRDLDQLLEPLWSTQYAVEQLAARDEELAAVEQAATEMADAARGDNATVLRALSIRVSEIRRGLEGHRADAIRQLLRIEEQVVARRGVPDQLATQMTTLQAGCDEGHAPSCYRVGLGYAEGVGVPADPNFASTAFASACEVGHARSCFTLGMLQLEGKTFPGPDGPWPLLLKGCDGKVAESCQILAERTLRGEGIERDPIAAAGLFRRSCVGGQVGACVQGGLLYRDGEEGLPRNGETAAFLLELGCDAGSAVSCGYLGEILLKGIGVSVDADRGKELLGRACSEGDAAACAIGH